MSLATHIAGVAESKELRSVIAEAATTVGLTGADAAALTTGAEVKLAALKALALALPEAEDEEDLYRSLAAMWLELRFEWERYNQVTNYQLVRTGAADPLELARGSAVSAIITHLEHLLGPSSLSTLAEHAMALLDRVRPDIGSVPSGV